MEAELAALFTDSVTVEPASGLNKSGKPGSYGASKTYAAFVQGRVVKIRGRDGQEKVSTVQVYLETADAIGVNDRITLPSRFSPNQPAILAVSPVRDEQGVHHTVVYCG